MIKKITALALGLVMMFSVCSYAKTFTDVADNNSETSEAISVLSELGVISGMGDGTFSPYTSLTRAQFAKIAVCIMGKTKEAVATTDAFSDVKSTDWYSGYVNVVAKDGIIAGYPDGSFGANDPVTYAQAITIVVRLLGYSAEDVGHKWPQGYIDKANVLNLTDGMTFSNNDAITREMAAVLIYRALFTEMNSTKTDLITKMDKNVFEDTVVIATKNENITLLPDQVQTDKGTFTFDKNVVDMGSYIGLEGTMLVNDEAEIIAFVESGEVSKTEYTVSVIYTEGNSDKISIITDDNSTVVLDTKTTMYVDGNAYTTAKLAEGLNAGSIITLYSKNGSLKHVFVDEYEHEGPKTVTSSATVAELFDIKDETTLKVIRKGISATIDDIAVHDVLYYSERTNTLYAYADKITGVYEEAYPMKSNVSRVKVSGVEYSLSSITAVNKLNESDSAYAIGDRVTLLLGEDGNVVDAVSLVAEENKITVYAVLTGWGSEISEDVETKGKTEYYITVMKADGTEAKYPVKDDEYEEKAGQFCEIDFEDTYAVLTFPTPKVETGRINKDTKTLGKCAFADDYSILEYIDGDKTSATVVKTTIAEVDNTNLFKTDVKHVQFNMDGEIEVLYINNVVGDRGIYGILISVPEKSGAYTIMSGATRYTVVGTYPSYKRGDCVEYKSGVNGTEMNHMTNIAKGKNIDSYTDNKIRMNNESYVMADDVRIYAGEYTWDLKSVSLDEALLLSGEVMFYSDRTVNDGGKVRIIRILTK